MELKLPPMLLTLVVMFINAVIARLAPSDHLNWEGSLTPAVVIAALGLAVELTAAVSFRLLGTTLNPTKPGAATVLVTQGIFRYSRNPMYVGFLLIIIAWSVYLANLPGLLLCPFGFVIYMNQFQILPEERMLLQRFGKEYEVYLRRVRRWL